LFPHLADGAEPSFDAAWGPFQAAASVLGRHAFHPEQSHDPELGILEGSEEPAAFVSEEGDHFGRRFAAVNLIQAG
jgi:hypothetical protein